MAFSLLVWGFGESMFFYFLPLSLQAWGATPVLIGAVLGGIGLAAAIAQIPAGYLSDKYGPRFILWAGWTLGMCAALMMALARSMMVFVVAIWIYYFTAFAVAPMNSYITMVRGRLSVERSLTFVGGLYNLGTIAGPIVGGLIAKRFGLTRIYLASFFIFVLSTILILFLKPRKIQKSVIEQKQVHLFRNTRYVTLLLLTFFVVVILYMPQPLTSNFLQNQHNLSLVSIGTLGTIGNAGNAFATLILGSMNATAGLITGQIMVALFSACLYFGNVPWVFGLGYFLLGGYRLTRSMVIAKIRSSIRDHEVGLAFGIVETVNGIALVITPPLAGWIYQKNPSMIYLISIPLILLLVIFSSIVIRKPEIEHSEQIATIKGE